MSKKDLPKPCACGCDEVWCVVDYGAWHIECADCCRHTGPYYDLDNAVRAWNLGSDVREAGSTKGDARWSTQPGRRTV